MFRSFKLFFLSYKDKGFQEKYGSNGCGSWRCGSWGVAVEGVAVVSVRAYPESFRSISLSSVKL